MIGLTNAPPTPSTSIDLNRRTAARSLSLGDRSATLTQSRTLEVALNPSRHFSHFPSGSNTFPLQSPRNAAASNDQLNALLQQWVNSQQLAPNQGTPVVANSRRVPVQAVAREHRREHAEEHMRQQRAVLLQQRRQQNGELGEEEGRASASNQGGPG